VPEAIEFTFATQFLTLEITEMPKDKRPAPFHLDDEAFEQIVTRAFVIDSDGSRGLEDLADEAARLLCLRMPAEVEIVARRFIEGVRMGTSPIANGVALPHLRLPEITAPEMVLVRSRKAIEIKTTNVFGKVSTADVFAIFCLVSPQNEPGQHLRVLADLASRADEPGFLLSWLHAGTVQELKEALVHRERVLSVVVRRDVPAGALAEHAIRDLPIPHGCLIALIERNGEALVPNGETVILAGDRLTVLGSRREIDLFRRVYSDREC
jgi:mannitol/fructose-specific phosphotransferase system IIA component (Ntr-type)